MNIFHLDKNPKICAEYHCDKHVVKMILETAQMLSTSARARGYDVGYKSAYPKHPMTLWVNQSPNNFAWAIIHGLELCKEYTYRYGKIHKTQQHLEWLSDNTPDIPSGEFTHPTLAMPKEYKSDDHIESYRLYYIKDKSHLHSWKKREIPEFI